LKQCRQLGACVRSFHSNVDAAAAAAASRCSIRHLHDVISKLNEEKRRLVSEIGFNGIGFISRNYKFPVSSIFLILLLLHNICFVLEMLLIRVLCISETNSSICLYKRISGKIFG
jgi:hypothetical protein